MTVGPGPASGDHWTTWLRRVVPWVQELTVEPGTLRWGQAVVDDVTGCRKHAHGWLTQAAEPSGPGSLVLSVRLRLATARNGVDHAEGYRLTLRQEENELTLLVVGADQPGLSHGARTAAALLEAGREEGLPPLRIDDWPAIARRGFMEAHYGRAWSARDRVHVLEHAARWGANMYHYSVGEDEYQVLRWADPYPPDRLESLAVGARRARELDITPSWGVSASVHARPELGAHLSSPTDVARLAAKIEQVASIGFRRCLLAFDDLMSGLIHEDDRAIFGSDQSPLAAAHAAFANGVLAALEGIDVELTLVPTLYWGIEDIGEYRKRLGELLDPRIPVWWTGPQVISFAIGATDARQVAQQFGRNQIGLWDNYPVNDWDGTGDMQDDLAGHLARQPVLLELGPLRGREAGVASAVWGYQASAGNEAAAKIPVIATAAMWAWNPDRYDPDLAWDLAVADTFRDSNDPMLGAAYRRFAALHELSPVAPTAVGWLRPLVHAFLAGPASDTATALRGALDEAGAVAQALRASSHPSARALSWWLDCLAEAVAVGRRAVDLLEAASARGTVPKPEFTAFNAQIADSRARGLKFTALRLAAGGALTPLLEQAVAAAGPAGPPVDFFASGPRS